MISEEHSEIVAQLVLRCLAVRIVCFSNMRSQQEVTRCITCLKRNCWIK